MDKEYDFSKGIKNPFTKMLKTEITINISNEALDYFQEKSKLYRVSVDTLINIYLTECAEKEIDPYKLSSSGSL